MVIQKVNVAKLTTEDGKYSLKEGSQVGIEGWVIPSRIAIMRFRNTDHSYTHRWVVAMVEDPLAALPVELLSFTNEFKTVSDNT